MNFYYILYFSKKGGRREEAAEALQIHTRVTYRHPNCPLQSFTMRISTAIPTSIFVKASHPIFFERNKERKVPHIAAPGAPVSFGFTGATHKKNSYLCRIYNRFQCGSQQLFPFS